MTAPGETPPPDTTTPPDTTMTMTMTMPPPPPPPPEPMPDYEPLGLSTEGLRSISNAAVSVGTARRSNSHTSNARDAFSQQSTNRDGDATNDLIQVNRLAGTVQIQHYTGDSGRWDVDITPRESTDLFSEDLTGATAWARATVLLPNSDWHVAGYWAYVPDDQSAVTDFELGAFATARNAVVVAYDIGSTETNAVYTGNALGLLLGTGKQLEFTGDIRMVANFAADEVTGVINGIEDLDGNAIGMQLDLSTATLQNNGFFSSGAGGLSSSASTDSEYENISGSWGGSFTGADEFDMTATPPSAAGTFGGKDTVTGDVLVGGFIVTR